MKAPGAMNAIMKSMLCKTTVNCMPQMITKMGLKCEYWDMMDSSRFLFTKLIYLRA